MSIRDRLKGVFEKVFGPEIVFSDSLSRSDIDLWDSLMHMNLLICIEKEFDLRFSSSEIVELVSVKKIIEFLTNAV